MFSQSAQLYDLIYSSFKDYPAESAKVAGVIRQSHPNARTVLDVACGTGEHARMLSDDYGFDVDGLDLDPAFVEIARSKLHRGSVFQGDMISFELPRRYDVVLCLFSSIGYVLTLDNVQKTLMRFREHLAPGGIVVVEPWFPPGVLQEGRVALNTAESDSVRVARMSWIVVEDRRSRIHFEYLIGRPTGIEHASEIHELGLFTTEEMIECFRRANMDVAHDPVGVGGRGLFLARS